MSGFAVNQRRAVLASFCVMAQLALALIASGSGAARAMHADADAAQASASPPVWKDGYCRRAADKSRDAYSIAKSAANCAATDQIWFIPRLSGSDADTMLAQFLAGLPRWIATLAPHAEPESYWRTRFRDADSRYLVPRAERVQVRELATTQHTVDWYPAADMGDREDIERFYAILVVDAEGRRSELRLTADYDREGSSFRIYVEQHRATSAAR
jgi:hypothetical protein